MNEFKWSTEPTTKQFFFIERKVIAIHYFSFSSLPVNSLICMMHRKKQLDIDVNIFCAQQVLWSATHLFRKFPDLQNKGILQ